MLWHIIGHILRHYQSTDKISGQLENSGQLQDNLKISGISGPLGPL
jgi:hypothetical protein